MKITHLLDNQRTEKESKSASFLMTNKNKGFCWINCGETESRYQGIFFSEKGKIFRVIEDLRAPNCGELKNKFWCVERFSEKAEERFFMPDFMNCFLYETNSDCDIMLDFKEAYENFYSTYEVEEIERGVLVKITYKNEIYFLAIRSNGKIDLKKQWLKKRYAYDEKRSSYPFERSVFRLGRISGKVLFSFSSDRDAALRELVRFSRTNEWEGKKKNRINSLKKIISKEKVNMAYNACRIQLDNLSDENGVFAGLPWFFQYWSRDELISLKALSGIDKEGAKKILRKWTEKLNFPMPSQRTINNEFIGNSADAAGWIFKRLEFFPDLVQENKDKLLAFVDNLKLDFDNTDGYNWMDSIKRDGPVEISAIKLYFLKFASKFKQNNYEDFKNKFKEVYFSDGKLYDSFDRKIRPNIFIVYYFLPELFSKEEWEKIFDSEIPELWCNWGGLSTISNKDSAFKGDYTGEAPGSYHNGDSWFWVNNLAGLCLADLNKEKYYKYIKEILNASTEEILFSGAIANHSELSSASSLRSEGAICQAFSAAMFIELVDKLKGL